MANCKSFETSVKAHCRPKPGAKKKAATKIQKTFRGALGKARAIAMKKSMMKKKGKKKKSGSGSGSGQTLRRSARLRK